MIFYNAFVVDYIFDFYESLTENSAIFLIIYYSHKDILFTSQNKMYRNIHNS